MLKAAQIFWANFFISPASGMLVSSSHQWGVSNWWTCHSSQPVIGISKKCSNSGLRVGGGPRSPSSTSPLVECSQGSLWGLHQRMSPPQVCKRLHVSLACVGLGTGHASPGIYPKGGCGCGGISSWHCWLFCLAFQYSIPKHGQHSMPIGLPPWLPGGP